MDGEGVFTLAKAVERSLHGGVERLGRDIPVEIEAPGIRPTDHGRIGQTGAQQVNRGMLESVVAARAQQDGRGE